MTKNLIVLTDLEMQELLRCRSLVIVRKGLEISIEKTYGMDEYTFLIVNPYTGIKGLKTLTF